MNKNNITELVEFFKSRFVPTTEKEQVPLLFDVDKIEIDNKDEFTVLEFNLAYLPDDKYCKLGDPVPKQSVRTSLMREKNGDIKTYRDISTGKLEAMMLHYTPAYFGKLKTYQQLQMNSYLSKNHRGFKPFEKEVFVLKVEYVFSMLKGFSKKKSEEIRTNSKVHFKTTKPDLPDNLKKPLFDAMSEVIFKDDALVCFEGITMKRYGLKPGVKLVIMGR